MLDRLIDEELLWQRARDGGYEVAPARVEEDLDRIRAGFESEQMYRARLRIFGITEPELAAQITRRLSIRRLLDELVVASVTVSEEEIRVYYEAHREQFIDKEQVHARHILLKVPEGADQAAVEAVQARAEQLAAEARAGADFAELARLHSQGPSAPTGGDLGWFGRGRMVPGFELAAFRLQPGEISAPVSTEFGIHVIKVEERRRDVALAYEEVAPALEGRLLVERREQALADFVAALRAAADIEVADVQ